jgi:ribosome biogenesis GTPase
VRDHSWPVSFSPISIIEQVVRRNNTVSSRKEKQWQHYEANKAMRSVRKQIKRNRKPKQVRRKDWSPDNFDDLDDVDYPQVERIMPRGERERRRANVALAEVEVRDETPLQERSPGEDTQGQRGIVVEVSSSLCHVDLDGRNLVCSLRGSLSAQETGYTNVVAVGDEVLVSKNGAGQGVVERVLPRRTVLARPDVFYSHLQQIIVANVAQLLIVASWRDPSIWLELIDRYLIAAERYGLLPAICVNKIDLAEEIATCRATLQPYLELGYRVIFTSALTGKGVGKLRKVLRGQRTVLAGLSGVGKSSLLAAVQPGLQIRTGEVNEQSGQGQHTTTQVTLHRLEAGGFVVDAPGIREFGLSGLRQAELARFYPEIAVLAGDCRFADCTHIHEPGCAVQAAVEQADLPATRYHNYHNIYQTLPA